MYLKKKRNKNDHVKTSIYCKDNIYIYINICMYVCVCFCVQKENTYTYNVRLFLDALRLCC
jgi:hypothetical protein